MQRRQFMKLAAGVAAGATAHATFARAVQAAGMAPPVTLAQWRSWRRFVSTPMGRISVVERGRGPAALFLHGFPLSGFQWRDAVAGLSAHRRCIAPDFLALGDTEPAPGQPVGPDAQVTMLVHLMDRLGVAEADVIANDSGGAVAQLLLVRHPRRVRSLLLTNCDSEPDCPPAALAAVVEDARHGQFADKWLLPAARDHRVARSPDNLGGQCYFDPASPTDEAVEAYLVPPTATAERRAIVNAFALALERNSLQGVAPALKASRTPVRIVWGTADTIFAAASPAYLAQAFGNGQGVRRLDGYKLFWPEERPDVIIEEALRLWAVDSTPALHL